MSIREGQKTILHKIIRIPGIVQHYLNRRAVFIEEVNVIKRELQTPVRPADQSRADRNNLRRRARGLNDRVITIGRIIEILNEEVNTYQVSALRLHRCAERVERMRQS